MWELVQALLGTDSQTLADWAAVVSAIAAVLTLAVLVVAAAVAWWQVQEAKSNRHAALMADLSRRWDDDLLVESRRLGESYTPERLRRRIAYLTPRLDPELFVLQRMPNFLEDLAILEAAGAISFEMIRQSLGGTLVGTWDHWQPTIKDMRGDQKYDLVYENFQRLAERMREELRRLGDLPGMAD